MKPIQATATWIRPVSAGARALRLASAWLPPALMALLAWLFLERVDLQVTVASLAAFVWWGVWIQLFMVGRSFPIELVDQHLKVFDPRGRLEWPLVPQDQVQVVVEATARPVRRHEVPMMTIRLQTPSGALELRRIASEEHLADLPQVPWTPGPALEVWHGDEPLFEALLAADGSR